MPSHLNPYDTGERLEPSPWSLEHPDRYGIVDFDDAERATVFTVVGKKPDDPTTPGYLLSINTCTGTPAVELDGDRVLVLDEDMLAGLNSLVALAQSVRESFLCQAATTADYSDDDVRAAAAWRLAQRAITAIEGDRP